MLHCISRDILAGPGQQWGGYQLLNESTEDGPTLATEPGGSIPTSTAAPSLSASPQVKDEALNDSDSEKDLDAKSESESDDPAPRPPVLEDAVPSRQREGCYTWTGRSDYPVIASLI